MSGRKVKVAEIINAVCTDMFQIARIGDFPFEDDAQKIQQKLLSEYPGVFSSTESHQKEVSKELRDTYIDLLKKVQKWEKETDQQSVIQFYSTG